MLLPGVMHQQCCSYKIPTDLGIEVFRALCICWPAHNVEHQVTVGAGLWLATNSSNTCIQHVRMHDHRDPTKAPANVNCSKTLTARTLKHLRVAHWGVRTYGELGSADSMLQLHLLLTRVHSMLHLHRSYCCHHQSADKVTCFALSSHMK